MPTSTEASLDLSGLSIVPERDCVKSLDLLPKKSALSMQKKKRKIDSVVPASTCLIEGEEKKGHMTNKSPFFKNLILKRFRNGHAPIAYKENFLDGKPRSTDIVHKIMVKRESKLSPNLKSAHLEKGYLVPESKSYRGLFLEKLAEGRWVIKDSFNNHSYAPEAGQSYIFVTMPSGRIRVSIRGKDGHLSLSEMARYVRYAGEVVFDSQQCIASWNNRSFAYCSAPFLAYQAGFNDGLGRFKAILDRNNPQKQSTPIFTK